MGGIINGGWTLVYNDTPNLQMQVDEHTRGTLNLMYSIGVIVDGNGQVHDINPDLAAAKAALAPGMVITKVNGGDFTVEGLSNAVAATKANNSGIAIDAQNGSESQTYKLNYSGGQRYPHLVRDSSKPDYLMDIAKPR